MVGFARIWGIPKESPKTMISDGEHFALEDERRFWNLKIEELCLSMQHFGMRDKPGFLERLSKAVNETPSGHDVANLSELEGIPEADEEVVVKSVNGKKFSLPGSAVRETWKRKYTLSEWPEVAYALTRLVGDYQDTRLGVRPETALVPEPVVVDVRVRIGSQQHHGSVCQVREGLVDLGDLAGRQ